MLRIVVKWGKYSPVKFANFVYLALRAEQITIFETKVVIFTYKYIQNLLTSRGYIFFILQHLATNLCSFTHSRTLFLAVVLDFVLLALIKIQSIPGITSYIYRLTMYTGTSSLPTGLDSPTPCKIDKLWRFCACQSTETKLITFSLFHEIQV
jgi:hypothetical protein